MKDRSRQSQLARFQKALRYTFRSKALIGQALTHRSYAYEHPKGRIMDNERLEFLGDAVLGLAISAHIYRKFPDCQEGEMTRIRSLLVNRQMLESLARKLSIGKYVLFGKGEAASGGAEQSRNLVCAYEAVIGAIYIDGGAGKAERFIASQFRAEIKKVKKGGAQKDYKSVLQEYTSKTYKATPRYTVVSEEGPDHLKCFEVAVSFGGAVRGTGEGKNKKSAEQDAAYNALYDEGLLDKSNEGK
ncbi:MAG TPA: ribonuclease III [Candidatus Omnitrophota bacterium]|nr:ribonuclease III [Candidatus Omnitrophota bacterium]